MRAAFPDYAKLEGRSGLEGPSLKVVGKMYPLSRRAWQKVVQILYSPALSASVGVKSYFSIIWLII